MPLKLILHLRAQTVSQWKNILAIQQQTILDQQINRQVNQFAIKVKQI